jgi:uncharacterized protein YqgC (DUF456 family)
MLDWFLLILAIVMILIGLIGCVLPVIPGPPLSFIGLLLLQFTKFGNFTSTFLLLMAAVAIIVTVLDYIVPIWGTKKFGGSKAGIWGATIGLVLGIFVLPPIGIIIGPLVGAIIAESLKGKDFNKSLKAGFGSLVGFAMGIGLKLATSGVMTWYFFKELFSK